MPDATLTDAYLREIEALCQAATPGPWQCADPMKKDRMIVSDAVGEVCKTDLYGFEYPESFSNGEFIAAARTAIPALIAEIRRLRAQVEELELSLRDAEERADTAYTHGYNVATHGGYKI